MTTKLTVLRDDGDEQTDGSFYDPERLIKRNIAAIAEWADEAEAVYEVTSGSFIYRGESRSVNFMGTVAHQALKHKKMTEKECQVAFRLFADLQKEHLIEVMRQNLPLQATESDEKLIKFIAFMTGTETPKDLDVHVFKHFLWQIKRKIHDLPTEWEMMPLFTGGQGFGKTRHLEKLWASVPGLSGFTADGQRLSLLKDEFGRKLFTRCYIIPFDEMANAASIDMETLKMMITARSVDSRIMRAEEFQRFKVNATLYGTSNVSGSANLSDATGMRRFWEFKAPNRQFKDSDGEFLDQLGLLGVFGCIDARIGVQSPIKPYLTDLSFAQAETFKARDWLSQFFDEYVIVDEAADSISRAFLYKVFRAWAQDQGAQRLPNMSSLQEFVYTKYGKQFVKKPKTGVEFSGLRLNSQNVEILHYVNALEKNI